MTNSSSNCLKVLENKQPFLGEILDLTTSPDSFSCLTEMLKANVFFTFNRNSNNKFSV